MLKHTPSINHISIMLSNGIPREMHQANARVQSFTVASNGIQNLPTANEHQTISASTPSNAVGRWLGMPESSIRQPTRASATNPGDSGQRKPNLRRRIIDQDGAAKFDPVNPDADVTDRHPVRDRLGWTKGKGTEQRWLIPTETWKKTFCAGFDPHEVAKVLAARGMLDRDNAGKFSLSVRIEGQMKRVYILTPKVVGDN